MSGKCLFRPFRGDFQGQAPMSSFFTALAAAPLASNTWSGVSYGLHREGTIKCMLMKWSHQFIPNGGACLGG